jgi:hypothetical protein
LRYLGAAACIRKWYSQVGGRAEPLLTLGVNQRHRRVATGHKTKRGGLQRLAFGIGITRGLLDLKMMPILSIDQVSKRINKRRCEPHFGFNGSMTVRNWQWSATFCASGVGRNLWRKHAKEKEAQIFS